jgi:hypothetical protein
MELQFFVFWLIFSIVVGIGAAGRGRNGAGWFLLSMVISPVLAFLLLVLLPSRSKSAGAPETQHLRKCPHCAELILREAKKCKHCASAVEPLAAAGGEGDSPAYGVGKALGRVFGSGSEPSAGAGQSKTRSK